MTKFVIEGGHQLAGNIRPVGHKNAALPMLAACLLSDEPITLHNLPLIGDVRTMLRILEEMGVEISQRDASVTLCARKVNTSAPDARLFSQIRGSLTLMGPLLGRSSRFLVDTAAGGDDIGRRRIDTHLQVLGALGVTLRHNGKFELVADGGLVGRSEESRGGGGGRIRWWA